MPLPDPFLKRIIRFSRVALLVLLGLVPMTACRSKPSNVRLEAKFVEVGEEEKNSLRRLISSASPPGVEALLDEKDLAALVQQLETSKEATWLSVNRVIVKAGQKARIRVGRDLAYKDATGKLGAKELGIVLQLLPRLKPDNRMDLTLSPQVVTIDEAVNGSKNAGKPPSFQERKTTVRLQMSVGQTVVLALDPASPTGPGTNTGTRRRHLLILVTYRTAEPEVAPTP